MQNNALPIVIVGGGIGGMATALALSQKNIKSVLLEQSAEFKEGGAGIQVGPNGYKALEMLGVVDAVKDLAVYPDELIMMNAVTSEPVTVIPAGQQFLERFKYPYSLVHRADLHSVLLDACKQTDLISFRLNSKLASYEQDSEGVVVTLESGESVSGSALVGADGLWSKVRQNIVQDGTPEVSGHIAYRAVLPTSEVPEQYRKNSMILWAGPKCHLVQYPLRGGKLFNLVAVFHSDKYVEGWNTEGDAEELKKRFEGTCETVQALLSKISSWRMWVLCDRKPVSNWTDNKVALLGDAAHPMLQYLAQGACMALEDALVLAEELSKASDIESAFKHYQQRRYLRAGRCQIMARVHGEFYHAEGVAAELRNIMFANRTAEQAYAGLSWLYEGKF